MLYNLRLTLLDKFTVRGLVYSAASILGLSYEIIFIRPPRLFLVIMYTIIIGIGLICIFLIKEQNEA